MASTPIKFISIFFSSSPPSHPKSYRWPPKNARRKQATCLPEQPWHKFPFTGFVAMLSAILTLMVDSLATSLYSQKHNGILTEKVGGGHQEVGVVGSGGHFHGRHHSGGIKEGAQGVHSCCVLELGIIVHSVVIGLSMGASNNTCTIKPPVAALCFHQMFEGMGLGGCILQELPQSPKQDRGRAPEACARSWCAQCTVSSTQSGMDRDMWYGGLLNGYSDNSPTALIVVGVLNASSVGLLNDMALVDLLAADFMGNKLQENFKLQMWAFVAVLLGAGGRSLVAKWA
ncbi:zinc transporter 10 precursor [Actinidia rufa]|uniref:Zinc transporter 10 n=1 Tax=Actinidia rufa TaxID=165716 RepID=A0A7J0DLW7_9ERIC|nr:zinc transporter 10 precursor [Actinidia rufa]